MSSCRTCKATETIIELVPWETVDGGTGCVESYGGFPREDWK